MLNAASTSILDVIWPRLISIAEEISITLIRTAFSHDVVVAHDMSAALFDSRGYMLAQTQLGATGHVGSMPYFVKDLLARVPPVDMRPGDCYVTNDPWLHSGHTADVFAVAPIFHRERLVAFSVTCVHHVDVGGRRGSTASEEVFEEGLILPLLAIYREGRENAELVELISRNVRFHEKVIGDLRAQVSACAFAGQLISELLEREGLADLTWVADEIAARTEAGMRAGIRRLADGRYTTELALDTEVGDPAIRIVLTLTKAGDELFADFTGSSEQVRRPINCPINYARAYIAVAAKMVVDPTLPNNEGTYRLLHVSAPEGSLLNPNFPAPVFWRYVTGMMVAEMMLQLLGELAPDRALAGSGSIPACMCYVSGLSRANVPFVSHGHYFGGMGGRLGRDGLSAVSFPYNVRDLPIEVVETETPQLLALERELIINSGGAGTWRGGLGERMVMTVLPDDLALGRGVSVSGGPGRLLEGARGLGGGKPGATGRIQINGTTMPPKSAPDFSLSPGDVISLELPGGGEFGPPEARDPRLIEDDIRNGYVSPQHALEDYGSALLDGVSTQDQERRSVPQRPNNARGNDDRRSP